MTDAVPPGYHTVTPYVIARNAAAAIDFAKAAFDAKELHRMTDGEGKIRHAEIEIGDSRVMLAEATPEWPPLPTALFLYVASCDATYDRALAAGAVSLQAPSDRFYGDRMAGVQDACGNQWWIAQHIEDVSAEELHRRHQEAERLRHSL
jgi:PhnB protein